MRRIGDVLARILLFIPRLLKRLVSGKPKPTMGVPPAEEEAEPIEPQPAAEAPPPEGTSPPQEPETTGAEEN
jgi:hypothetical protein